MANLDSTQTATVPNETETATRRASCARRIMNRRLNSERRSHPAQLPAQSRLPTEKVVQIFKTLLVIDQQTCQNLLRTDPAT